MRNPYVNFTDMIDMYGQYKGNDRAAVVAIDTAENGVFKCYLPSE